MSMQNMVFFQENAKLVEKTKKPGPFLIFFVCARPTTYNKNHIPFSFSFSNDWDGQCGRQLKPKYVSYACCPYTVTIASEVSVYMVLDEATPQDRFISHLI